MNSMMNQFPATNPNPVLSVEKDGTVLYSNEAGEPLLHEWGVEIGEKLPSHIVDIVQRVVTQNGPEKVEVKAGKRVYLLAFHPLPEEECVNIYGFVISEHKESKEKFLQLDILEKANLELAEIIDSQAIQSLMNDFYKLVHIPIGLKDLKGNVLVGVGWQDICTKFHRIHPEACKHCVESDIKLSAGVSPGEFKLYKCKNNMWDMATPIIVGGQHVGYIFSGQFFFEDEPLDDELFRSQARQYGFNEEEYIAALEKVPRLNREAMDRGMTFLANLASMTSQLSYSNIKLVQSLSERNELVAALQESEERFRWILENSLDAAYRRNLQTGIYDYMSPIIEQITGYSDQEMSAMSINDALDHIHPDDRPLVASELILALDIGIGTFDYRFKRKDGKYRWLADYFKVIKDQNGSPLFIGGVVRDITKRKQAEEALRLSNHYNRSLIEASLDPLVTIGHDGKITDVNGATEKVTGYPRNRLIGTDFSDYFSEPEIAHAGYEMVFTDGEVRDYPLFDIRMDT
jgi:PAS domain S-box-containing protein